MRHHAQPNNEWCLLAVKLRIFQHSQTQYPLCSGPLFLVFEDRVSHWPGAGHVVWDGWPVDRKAPPVSTSPALGLHA